MQILIRNIQRSRKGDEEVLEDTLANPLISVGRLGDQVIQLLDPAVAPRHLLLTARSDGRFRFQVVDAAPLEIVGKTHRDGTLSPGQGLDLGAQRVQVLEPPHGFDAALEVTRSELDKSVQVATQFRTRLAETSLSGRKVAWALALLIPLLFLVLPVLGFMYADIGNTLRQSPLLASDGQWSSGPLANAHHIPGIADNCTACHVKLFARVPNSTCVACHENVKGHVNWHEVSVPRLTDVRCASCHVEHNEPANLVRNDPQLCIDCHADLGAVAKAKGGAQLALPVTGFSKQAHPEFQLALLKQVGVDDRWHVQQATLDASLTEQSNLTFPHKLHMNPDKVQDPETGATLTCASCHALKEEGKHFAPIKMETTCRGCHSLTFDDDFPDAQLPHGDVQAAILMLQDHFIRQYADPTLRHSDDPVTRKRPTVMQAKRQCQGSAFECGEKLSLLAATDIFTRTGCVTCHKVTTRADLPLSQRWSVQPVRLQTDWYPFEDFNHKVHMTRSKQDHGGAQVCASCHAAKTSDASTDILIPGIESCVQCHGPVQSTKRVASTCATCHAFHLPFREPMMTAETINAGAQAPSWRVHSSVDDESAVENSDSKAAARAATQQ